MTALDSVRVQSICATYHLEMFTFLRFSYQVFYCLDLDVASHDVDPADGNHAGEQPGDEPTAGRHGRRHALHRVGPAR